MLRCKCQLICMYITQTLKCIVVSHCMKIVCRSPITLIRLQLRLRPKWWNSDSNSENLLRMCHYDLSKFNLRFQFENFNWKLLFKFSDWNYRAALGIYRAEHTSVIRLTITSVICTRITFLWKINFLSYLW